MLQQMFKRPTFHEILHYTYGNDLNLKDIDIDFVAGVIKNYYKIGDNTARRRSSTVLSWLKWIDDNVEFK